MKNYSLKIFCFTLFASFSAFSQDLLQKKIREGEISAIASNIEDWRQSQFSFWEKTVASLPEDVKNKIVKDAEKSNEFQWPSLKAYTFLDFKNNGNRTNHESAVNERRLHLNTLMVGELVERKGRFLPQIVNGLWLTLEESTWVLPAHLAVQKLGVGLPNISDPYIDLGAARQAVDVAFAYFFFKEDFDKIAKQINGRILHELDRRIFTPYLERNDFWWMALGEKTGTINNWNIWINTNVLKCFLLIENDRLSAGISKIIRSSDKFINSYPEDGACDEGSSYWAHSGGELGIMLTWLSSVSNASISLADEKKIKNMGDYILNVHIENDRYANFADAHSLENPNPVKVWNFGKIFNDENLLHFASFLNKQTGKVVNNRSIPDFLDQSAIYKEIAETSADFKKGASHYYESMGLLTLNSNNAEGNLFFAGIGSHNGVSHNHNDVGSFMLFADGKPVLIDVGVGTYSAKTFSSKRYEIWNMQSQWHNLPIINGVEQKNGREFKAKHVSFGKNKEGFIYQVDISGAYPPEAQVKTWKRNFVFLPLKNTLQVKEDYVIEKQVDKQKLVFMTKEQPKIENNVLLIILPTAQKVYISFDKKSVEMEVEKVELDDPRLKKAWGNVIYRTKVTVLSDNLKNTFRYSINLKK